ncbi:hypothetical protein BYT27DRAFT_7260427 [Phlegmacium glaucopus]|nr:hypothetical protein BYT27DRAFT_7260427 [Phlegmacium glaucopus]
MYSISTPISSRGASTSNGRRPRPDAPAMYGHGHYVGVRINKYETKAQAKARGQGNTGMIHPAVVLAGPDANNRYDIATISTEHPDNPPRAPLNVFHPTTTITGDVSFYRRNVAHGDLRPWIDERSGNVTQPMSQSQLAMLRNQMIAQPPQMPPNGGYFPAASSPMGNRSWNEGSVCPQPVYGQQYMSHSTPAYPAHHQNPFPSNGQMYTPSNYQGMAHGYAAPYTVDPHRGGPPTSGRPPIYTGQDSTCYWYPPAPSTSTGRSI